jgi:DNA helicase-2/ATP-dependent DNA helicase PcrA
MKTIVLGPPGTGKTTTLLNKVDDYLKQTDPDKVGYFAFTQKAAHEARDRAIKKFNLEEDDLPYFRTLHSLAFRRLGIKKEDVMQQRHYQDFGKKIKEEIKYAEYENDHNGIFSTSSDYLRVINLAKLREITPEQQYNLQEHNQELELKKLKIIALELERYKKLHNLIDFNDMIIDFTKSDAAVPKFDVVFIDEAQDLSKMQWHMAKAIWQKTTDSFIAGDDDQAVFRWAGADVDSFIAQKGQMLPLQQSYRIPAKVHGLAMGIINKIKTRIDKTWQPRIHQGSLSRYYDFEDIDMSSGQWLVLARTKYMLDNLEEELYLKGYYYQSKFRKQREHTLHLAATDWENARKGGHLTYDQIERIYGYMSEKHAEKQKLKGMIKDSLYVLEMMKAYYGLNTDAVWYEAFDNAPRREVNYLKQMRRKGEKLNEAPRITLSTIHGAKGGECENVVLLTDLSLNTIKSYEKNPDDENRLFYVGATRTKEHLHIVEPKQKYKGYNL